MNSALQHCATEIFLHPASWGSEFSSLCALPLFKCALPNSFAKNVFLIQDQGTFCVFDWILVLFIIYIFLPFGAQSFPLYALLLFR